MKNRLKKTSNVPSKEAIEKAFAQVTLDPKRAGIKTTVLDNNREIVVAHIQRGFSAGAIAHILSNVEGSRFTISEVTVRNWAAQQPEFRDPKAAENTQAPAAMPAPKSPPNESEKQMKIPDVDAPHPGANGSA